MKSRIAAPEEMRLEALATAEDWATSSGGQK